MGATEKTITLRAPHPQDKWDRWEAELRLLEEGMRCSRVLAWARAPRRSQSLFLNKLMDRLNRLDAEMQADRRP